MGMMVSSWWPIAGLIPAHKVATEPPCCACFAGNSTKHNREQVKNPNRQEADPLPMYKCN